MIYSYTNNSGEPNPDIIKSQEYNTIIMYCRLHMGNSRL